MDLTTLQRVRDFLKVPTGKTEPDTLINQFIPQVSQAIERYLGREGLIQSTARIEYHDAEYGQMNLWLRAFPVTSIAEIANDYDRAFAATSVVDAGNYVLYPNTGRVNFYKVALIGGPQVVRVTYTGGIAANTAALVTAAPDLALACEMQVAFLFQRKNILGSTGSSSQGGSISLDKPGGDGGAGAGLIPEVVGILEPFTRAYYGVGTV